MQAGSSFGAHPDVIREMRGALDIRRRLLEIMDGDGSGPRISQPAPAAPRQLSEQAMRLPAAPPSIRSGLPVPRDADVGQWAGQRLEPEMGGAADGFGPAASAIPPEGLNPYWKPARDAYAGPVQNRKALELGEDMAKADAVDASNRMANMTGNQVDHFRLGHRSGMAQDLRELGDCGNAARRVDGSLAKRDAIATVHGPEASQALFDRLQAEHGAHQTWAVVRGNLARRGAKRPTGSPSRIRRLPALARGLSPR